MRRRQICTMIVLALVAGGCRAQKSAIVSPYQQALAAYYKALETESDTDLAAAEQEAAAILARDASDHTARILRANVSLSRLRLGRLPAGVDSTSLERKLLTDLVTLSAGVGTIGEAADWVPARSLVLMGDYHVLEGNIALANGGADQAKLVEAKTAFEAARHFYGGAAALADQRKADATPGLAREAVNARQGHLVALRGMLSALDTLDPDQTVVMASTLRSELVRAWEVQFSTGAVTTPSPGALSFNAADHTAARALYVTLGNRAQRQLADWCSANKALVQKTPPGATAEERKVLEEGTALLRRVLSMSEFEALHASVARRLRGSGDDTASLDKVLFLLKRDLKQSCG
jgi:hypothetical protein